MPEAPVLLSAFNTPTAFKGGTLVPLPIQILIPAVTDSAGIYFQNVFGQTGAPVSVFVQAVANKGGIYEMSNALEVVIGL